MTIAYNENLRTILWDTGIVTVARYCNWCWIFNIISVTQISGLLFLSKWLISLMGWDFFELADAILYLMNCILWHHLYFPSAMERVCCWFQSEYPLTLPAFYCCFRRMSDLPIRIIYVKVIFCLVLPMMGVFVVFLSLLPDKFSIILSILVVFLFLSFFISSSSDLIFVFSKLFSSEKLVKSYEFGVTDFIMSFTKCLTHILPMLHFCTPVKTSENQRFSDVFREYRKVTLGEYVLNSR